MYPNLENIVSNDRVVDAITMRIATTPYEESEKRLCEYKNTLSIVAVILIPRLESMDMVLARDLEEGTFDITTSSIYETMLLNTQRHLWRLMYLVGGETFHQSLLLFRYMVGKLKSENVRYFDILSIILSSDWNDFETAQSHGYHVVSMFKSKWSLRNLERIVNGEVTAPISPSDAAFRIQRVWKRAVSCPEYKACRNRLLRESTGMMIVSNMSN